MSLMKVLYKFYIFVIPVLTLSNTGISMIQKISFWP